MILRVGLTGGIASGKSTVARMLAEHGCRVVDADQIVRELYRPGQAGHRALVAQYGEAILDASGEIDRPALSRLALSTAEGAAVLNALIHPLVIAEQQRYMTALDSAEEEVIAVVEATLLLESGGRERFDKIIVVDVEPALQIARAVRRGLPEDEVRRRIARQMDNLQRLAQADYVIANSGDEAALAREAARVAGELRRDLRLKSTARLNADR